jgi:hypothetical protein
VAKDAGSTDDLRLRALGGAALTSTVANNAIGDFSSDGTLNDLGGHISADPLLTDPNEDPHLLSGSPAIDAGTCTGAPAADFEGDTRPGGTTCDIGADEFVP